MDDRQSDRRRLAPPGANCLARRLCLALAGRLHWRLPQSRPTRSPIHRAQVQANGASFHVIEQGQGPAVLRAIDRR